MIAVSKASSQRSTDLHIIAYTTVCVGTVKGVVWCAGCYQSKGFAFSSCRGEHRAFPSRRPVVPCPVGSILLSLLYDTLRRHSESRNRANSCFFRTADLMFWRTTAVRINSAGLSQAAHPLTVYNRRESKAASRSALYYKTVLTPHLHAL